MRILKEISITPGSTILNGKQISDANINGLYREFIGDYPKFFKMDSLCKLGFVGSDILLKDIPIEDRENGAVILFNRNGSLVTDRNYQRTLADDNYFPSPAIFVYTLANIVTGEIAIRNKMLGESSFYILPNPDEDKMMSIVANTFRTSTPSFILTGWVDYDEENKYLCKMKIVTK